MKLRNLLFGTMIACAFVACSNDDDPTPNVGPETPDGKTVLAVKYDVPTTTKAVDDDAITSLHMLVFSNGTLEVIGELKTGTTDVAEAAVNLSDKDILMLANVTIPTAVVPGAAKSAVLTELSKAQALEFDGDATDLSMNSKIYEGVTVTPETTNYLGWATAPEGGVLVGGIDQDEAKAKVKMYRNTAKVVLTTIKTKEGYSDASRVPYKAPQLIVKNVYILQAHQYSKIAPSDAAEYGATMLTGGYLSGAFTEGMNEEGDEYTLNEATQEAAYASTLSGTATTTASITVNKPFYLFENTNTGKDNSTLLVVEGEFSYENAQGERVTITNADGTTSRYYTIAVGQTKAVFSDAANALLSLRNVTADTKGVYRNLQYNISLTAVGPGYKRPTVGGDPTMLDVQVEVVAYGEVNQDVEI